MKITILVGTEISNSHTSNIIRKLQNSLLKNFGDKTQILIYNQENVQARHCIGCCTCFKQGFCVLKSKDNMEKVKENLIDSDIIILASPVYFHQVSGTMKVFIDRLSYWGHIFRLVGKIGMTVSISSSNGNEYVDFYLNKFLQYTGVIVSEQISILYDVDDEKTILNKIDNASENLYKKYMNPISLNPTQKQEIAFHALHLTYNQDKGGGLETIAVTPWSSAPCCIGASASALVTSIAVTIYKHYN